MAYTLAALLLGVVIGAALLRGRRRRVREMRALKTVMQQVMEGGPEAPRDED
ncbi:MAG TPA: hypothetical protein VFV77_02685 [Gammaproteobacteria bacterium]|nr:hypothetical protein [Gammaproteobacteria bacterium]